MDVVLEILCLSCHISTYKFKICNRIHISLNNILKIYLCPWQYFVCFSFGFFHSYLLAGKENIEKKRILPNVRQHVRGHSTTTWTEFCHFLVPPPSCVDSFYTLSVDKYRHFLTPSPPHLVHVVIEWPLRALSNFCSFICKCGFLAFIKIRI